MWSKRAECGANDALGSKTKVMRSKQCYANTTNNQHCRYSQQTMQELIKGASFCLTVLSVFVPVFNDKQLCSFVIFI